MSETKYILFSIPFHFKCFPYQKIENPGEADNLLLQRKSFDLLYPVFAHKFVCFSVYFKSSAPFSIKAINFMSPSEKKSPQFTSIRWKIWQ